MEARTKNGKVKQMKMGSKLEENEIKEYSALVDEFSDTWHGRMMILGGYLVRWWSIRSFDSKC